MADSFSAESEALKLAFEYLVNSIDTSSLLPGALSSKLITDRQRTDCDTEGDPYKKAEKFLGLLQREVNGDSNKLQVFVQLLDKTGQIKLASRLRDELSKATTSIQAVTTTVIVPEALVDELASLRLKYASFLRKYKQQLQNNSEAQEEFVETLPGLLRRKLNSERNFQSYFDTLVEEETSLFNITYLKHFCDVFPEDICIATKQLVSKYEEQHRHFMTGVTVNQFKSLFPASATNSELSMGKVEITLKLCNYWGENTLEDLTKLIGLFGIPGSHLHLAKAGEGSIIVLWLCSSVNAEELKGPIIEAVDTLQSMGVLQVFIGKELFLECYDQESLSHEARTFEFVNEPDSDYFCPVCRDLLTDPFQPECGHHLCHKCRDRLLSSKKSECPTCRESNALTDARLDKYFMRKLIM